MEEDRIELFPTQEIYEDIDPDRPCFVESPEKRQQRVFLHVHKLAERLRAHFQIHGCGWTAERAARSERESTPSTGVEQDDVDGGSNPTSTSCQTSTQRQLPSLTEACRNHLASLVSEILKGEPI